MNGQKEWMGRKNEWMNEWMNEWAERKNEWMNGQKEWAERMNGQKECEIYLFAFVGPKTIAHSISSSMPINTYIALFIATWSAEMTNEKLKMDQNGYIQRHISTILLWIWFLTKESESAPSTTYKKNKIIHLGRSFKSLSSAQQWAYAT